MSDNPLKQLQSHMQRAMAAADVVDRQLESVASNAVVGAAREFMNKVAALIEDLQPRTVARQLPAPAKAQFMSFAGILASPTTVAAVAAAEVAANPPTYGDEVQLPDGRVGVIRFVSKHVVEGEIFHVETRQGLVRVVAALAKKREGK